VTPLSIILPNLESSVSSGSVTIVSAGIPFHKSPISPLFHPTRVILLSTHGTRYRRAGWAADMRRSAMYVMIRPITYAKVDVKK